MRESSDTTARNSKSEPAPQGRRSVPGRPPAPRSPPRRPQPFPRSPRPGPLRSALTRTRRPGRERALRTKFARLSSSRPPASPRGAAAPRPAPPPPPRRSAAPRSAPAAPGPLPGRPRSRGPSLRTCGRERRREGGGRPAAPGRGAPGGSGWLGAGRFPARASRAPRGPRDKREREGGTPGPK